jgi:hypothetical protein
MSIGLADLKRNSNPQRKSITDLDKGGAEGFGFEGGGSGKILGWHVVFLTKGGTLLVLIKSRNYHTTITIMNIFLILTKSHNFF